MNITVENFGSELPSLLKQMSQCDYVAIDLEMSGGVATFRPTDPKDSPDLKEARAYAAARKGATRHNTVELGLTFIKAHQDLTGPFSLQSYTVKVKNLFLNDTRAASDLGTRSERIVDFSHSALLFLKKHKVDPMTLNGFFASSKAGVPYLSRQEHREALESFHRPRASEPLVDGDLDSEARKFRDEVVKQLHAWAADVDEGDKSLIIQLPQASLNRNRLCQRIIRHVVATETTNCEAWAFNSNYAMRISVRNEAAQNQRTAERLSKLQAALDKQVGMRIIFEALVGGNFTQLIDTSLILGDAIPEEDRDHEAENLRKTLAEYQATLKRKQPVVIGHNCFHDLCFLYDTFVGTLPESLEGFRRAISELFPRIVDTKVFAIQENPVEGEDPLQELYERMKNTAPAVTTSSPYRFGRDACAHNAGYDSYMTAIVFLALARNNAADGAVLGPQDLTWDERTNKIRLGRGLIFSLDEAPRRRGFCTIL